MSFEPNPKTQDLIGRVDAFMQAHVFPNEARFSAEVAEGDRWQPVALIEELKERARA